MKKQIDKLAALEEAIQRESETIQALEKNLQRTREEKERAAAEQQHIAYSALAENDTRAQVLLQECEATLSKFSTRVASCEAALQTAKRELETLRHERQDAFITQKQHEYADECAALLKDDAEQLERALTEMATARNALQARLRKMESLAVEAGIDASRVHARLRTNLDRCVAQRVQFEAAWLSREAREVFQGPVPAVFRSTIDGILGGLEPQREQRLRAERE